MGDNPRPNRSVTLDEMQCIQVLLEVDWDVHIGSGHVAGQLVLATNEVTVLAFEGRRYPSPILVELPSIDMRVSTIAGIRI